MVICTILQKMTGSSHQENDEIYCLLILVRLNTVPYLKELQVSVKASLKKLSWNGSFECGQNKGAWSCHILWVYSRYKANNFSVRLL